MWTSVRCTTVDASRRAVTTTVHILAAAKQASFWRPTARFATVSNRHCHQLRARLRSIVTSISGCVSVCLSARISPEPLARSLPFFVHVACVRGSVLLRHVYDRPHRLVAGKGFSSPLKMHYRPRKAGWECTARAKYAIYDCLVQSCHHCRPL